jgi:hypothetical protein
MPISVSDINCPLFVAVFWLFYNVFKKGDIKGAKKAGFSGFAWDCLGIKNPAKSDNLRGFESAWDYLKQT